MSTIVWIGFSQSLFAAILMYFKKDASMPDRILSGWLTLIGIEFLTSAIDYQLYNEPLLSSSFLLFNPALYLYILSLSSSNFKLKWNQLLHLLPFLIFEVYAYIINQPFLLQKYFIHDSNYNFRIIFAIATFTSWLIYNPLSLILVHRHRMHLKNEKSTIEKNENLGWILAVAIFYVVYCLFALGITIIVYFGHLNPLTPHYYNYSVLLFMVYVLGFYGLRQQTLSQELQIKIPKEKYLNSSMSSETKMIIRQKIINIFEQDKIFFNPDLNMDVLSQELKIPKYQITEVLNCEIGKNFYQYVNEYRIEAVKIQLSNPKNNYSIDAIGFDCGFSSKSSFYTMFKKLTGKTPVDFRNSIQS